MKWFSIDGHIINFGQVAYVKDYKQTGVPTDDERNLKSTIVFTGGYYLDVTIAKDDLFRPSMTGYGLTIHPHDGVT